MVNLSEDQTIQLRAIASVQRILHAGSVKILGLEEVRARLGDRWEGLKDKVFRHADIAIAAALSEGDVTIRLGDDGYFFVFANSDPEYAEETVAAVSDAILRRLFGEDADLAAQIDVASQSLSFDRQNLTKIMAGVADDLSDRTTAPPGEPRSPGGGRRRPAGLDKMQFRPVWDISRRAVFSFTLKPPEGLDEETAAPPLGAAETVVERRAALKRDLITIAAAERELVRLANSSARMLINACISASSFSTANLQAGIVAAIRAIPPELRQCLRFIVYETRTGAIARDADLALQTLAPHCRGALLSTFLDEGELRRAKAAGYEEVGVNIAHFSHIPEGVVMEKLARLLRSAHGVGLRSFVDGVCSCSMSSFLVCEGVDQIGGDVIGPPEPRIPAAIRYEAHHLYESHATAAGA